jgi:two-component system cell cycle sensor histidine kinase/response regulator CckA
VKEALRAREAEHKAILDASMDRITVVDKDLRIIWINETAAKEMDAAPEDLIGQPCYEVFAGEAAHCPGCPTTKALESGWIEHSLLHHFKSRGSKGEIYVGETYWDGYAVPLKNDSDDGVKVVQVFRNITDQMKAEAALRESEERFRAIFESSADAICVIDDQGFCVMVNDAMYRLTGAPRGELIGEHYSKFINRETHAVMEDYWQRRKRGE